jgi:hypothetical protein
LLAGCHASCFHLYTHKLHPLTLSPMAQTAHPADCRVLHLRLLQCPAGAYLRVGRGSPVIDEQAQDLTSSTERDACSEIARQSALSMSERGARNAPPTAKTLGRAR